MITPIYRQFAPPTPFIERLDELSIAIAVPVATESVRLFTATSIGAGSALLGVTVLEIAVVAGITYTVAMTILGKEALPTRFLNKLALVLLFNLSYPHFLIHEGGHAIASLLCFANASPSIAIKPFLSGSTRYAISNGLHGIGSLLGKSGSIAFCTAGGLFGSLLFATSEFALAKALEEKYPNFAHFLKLHGIAQLFTEGLYTLSAFWTSPHNKSHDLIRLWKDHNIHPIVPLILLIGIPLLEEIALKKA